MLPHRPPPSPGRGPPLLPDRGTSAYPAVMDKDGLIPIGRFARLTDLSPRYSASWTSAASSAPSSSTPSRATGTTPTHRRAPRPSSTSAVRSASPWTRWPTCSPPRRRASCGATSRATAAVVAAQLAEKSRLLRLLDRELARGEGLLAFEVALKEQPAVLVMSAAGSVPRTHPHDPWALEARLAPGRRGGAIQIARQGEEPDRHGVILYHSDFSVDDEISFEVCIPVPRRLPGCPGVECKELPAARAASLTFTGPYDTIWNAHAELRGVGHRPRLRAGRPAAGDGHRGGVGHRRPAGVGDGAVGPASLDLPPWETCILPDTGPDQRDRRRTRPRGYVHEDHACG